MSRPLALTWVACFMYMSVLLAGWFSALSGSCSWSPVRLAGFSATLILLTVLELLQGSWAARLPVALAALAVNIVLILAAIAADRAGDAKILLILLPFGVYFVHGRRAATVMALATLTAVAAAIMRQPHWTRDPKNLSEFVMFSIGIVFALAVAGLAGRAEAGRVRAEQLLADVSQAHARLREYDDQARSLAATTERVRIARDLHDTVGHHLAVVTIQLEKSVAYRTVDAAAADQALTDARRSARTAFDAIRAAVGALRSDPGDEFVLATALPALVNRLDDNGFRIEVRVEGDEAHLAQTARLALYLVAQEGLTNARRHSGASTTTVCIHHHPDASVLEVIDNGNGFPPTAKAGNGLSGMRERLELLGGELRVDTGRAGTRLVATIPLGAR